ncbi:MAG: GntR family transcriptional regulator, partial [Ruthenibacterium sp.]
MKGGKRQQAYELIKQKIFEGEYLPLSDISEEALQVELGISRTPIREALQKLNKEGFVNVYPRKGTIVADISLDMIRDLYEVRLLNEPFITRQACGRLSSAWLSEMKAKFENLPEDMRGNSEKEICRYGIELDRELHGTILRHSRNELLKGVMETVYDYSHWLRIRTSRANREYSYSVREHLAIIDALMRQDANMAEQASRKHV